MSTPLGNKLTKLDALNLCHQYLGQTWSTTQPTDVEFETVSGGLTNMLYKIQLNDNIPSEEGEPRQVLLRLYGMSRRKDAQSLLTDTTVFALLAERGLGPRLYGVFEEGRLEQYIPSRALQRKELHKPDLSAQCARMLAKLHKIEMPLNKEPHWLTNTMQKYLDEYRASKGVWTQKVPKEVAAKLKTINFDDSIKYIKFLIESGDYPVMFCHNDLQEGNILLCHTENNTSLLRPIDFEFASYNYRGYDFANHMCEWRLDNVYEQPPYFKYYPHDFPSKDEQLLFLRAYMDESGWPNNKSKKQVEKELLEEIKIFSPSSHLLWGIWALVQALNSTIAFDYWEYALLRLMNFEESRKALEKENPHLIMPKDWKPRPPSGSASPHTEGKKLKLQPSTYLLP